MTEAERLAKALILLRGRENRYLSPQVVREIAEAAALIRSQAAELEALREKVQEYAIDALNLEGRIDRRDNENYALECEVKALRADAEQLRLSLTFIVDRDLTYFDGYVDRHQISMGAIEQARRVLKSAAAIDAARQS